MRRRPTRKRVTLEAGVVGCALLVAGCASVDDSAPSASSRPISTANTDVTTASAAASNATDPIELPTTSTFEPSTTAPVAEQRLDPQLEQRLQAILDAAMPSMLTPEATLQAAVLVGSTDTSWSGAAGRDDDANRPFRMASVGKTFTAATTLRLVESGAFAIDDTIDGLLSAETLALLSGDGYRVSEITVEQLLVHTAGLFDYAFGEGSPMLQRALSDFGHEWTRAEQLQLAVDVGDPVAGPGAEFHYGDTGYVLLGEIIERTTGKPYAAAMRELLGYDRLGLEQVWLEHGENAPPGAPTISRSFFTTTELTDLDFSIDAFGGGGLAGTGPDIARFFEALLGGEVFDDPSTLDLMLRIPATNMGLEEFGIPFGDGASGLYRIEIAGNTCWNHRGFLGTIALACPAADRTVVVTTNTATTEPLAIASDLVIAMSQPRRD
ncbi:MAG: serine hydrolase domain-containing protein [Actinomycetota bacterium]|jgi:D-alanyl-D-alanine carboxypeptidase